MLFSSLYAGNNTKKNWVPIAVNDILTFMPYMSIKENIIKSTKISNDNKYLIINVKGNFIDKSHFELFINSDNNEKTGYEKMNGAEYLVENRTLFVYSGDGSNWKWTKIGNIESYSSGVLWEAKVPLSLLHLNKGDHIKYISRVLTSDWKIETYGSIQSYVLSNKYIVAKNGNDNDIGDENNPFKTIQNAINHAQAGDTIYVKSGTYYENLTRPLHSNAFNENTRQNQVNLGIFE
jgi:hypothetical protein